MARRIASKARHSLSLSLVLVLAAAMSISLPTHAAEPTTAERAQALFDAGRAAMDQNEFAKACAFFAESQALDPGGGTLLNLGICRRREGRTATAFQLLTESLALARARGRADRIATAEKQLAELAPQLSRLTVLLPPGESAAELLIAVDDAPLLPAQLGQSVPLDPGLHRVSASRPGYEAWSTSVTLGPVADAQAVTVPTLQPSLPAPVVAAAPSPAPAQPTPAPPSEPKPAIAERHSPNWLGIALVSAGGVALTAGTYFGVHALSLRSRSNRYYEAGACTTESCVEDWQDAKTSALLSDVALGVGIVAVGVGGYVLLSPRSEKKAGSPLALSIAGIPAGARAAVSGEF